MASVGVRLPDQLGSMTGNQPFKAIQVAEMKDSRVRSHCFSFFSLGEFHGNFWFCRSKAARLKKPSPFLFLKGQRVELVGSGRGCALLGQLSFFDHVHGLDARQDEAGTWK